MSYDNNMQVIVSKVVSNKQGAPTLRIQLEIDGVKYQAGVWPWKRKDGSLVKDKNENMQYKGKLEVDDYVPKGQSEPAPDFDDPIPF